MAPRPKSKVPLKARVVTVRIDPDTGADMNALRERDGIGISEQIRRGLRLLMESKGIRRKKA